jgi:SagB-type dehydrogenase family enzyme
LNLSCVAGNEGNQPYLTGDTIYLPDPQFQGEMSLERCLCTRRSQRDFCSKTTSLSNLSQLLWAAQGISDQTTGFRTAPSAGALYPFCLYVHLTDVEDLSPGIYRYDPAGHLLQQIKSGNFKVEILNALQGQSWIMESNIIFFLTVNFNITTSVYESRGERYIWIEAGHIAQNIYLQATALQLGSVAIGAYQDQLVNQILDLPSIYTCAYIMVVGEIY